MIIYLDIPSLVFPEFELDIGINSIGEAVSKAFEGIARSIRF
jgi:hypothetical protein